MSDRTIEHFGEQWTRYRTNEGYYGSSALLADVCEPLLPLARLAGKTVVEIGSGTGRIVNMLLDVGVAKVVAVEPSAAMDVLVENTRARASQVQPARVTGDAAPDVQADFVLSIGVLHHIPHPESTVRRAYEILRPGGEMLFWIYGREGNELYLGVFEPVRMVTPWIPDPLLHGVSRVLNSALTLYIKGSAVAPLPMHRYMRNVLGKLTPEMRLVNIFDQLNPQHAKYYKRDEALELMRGAGFEDVRIHHRHGYSWTVIGKKPERQP